MSKQIQTTKDDAQNAKQPLRFETVVTWDRPLTHECDEPSTLQKRLSHIPIDGDVSVSELTDTSARVIVETTLDEMNHSVGLITKKVRRVIRAYNQHVIGGDDLTDPPRPRGVRKKHVRHAYNGGTKSELNEHLASEKWEQAKAIAERLNLEGAPALDETEIHTRTLEGEPPEGDL